MSQEYYFQKGGAGLPYRWNNPNAQAFSPCQSCGKPKKPQDGGGNLPNRWFNPNTTPFGCDTGACQEPLAVYAKEFMESQASQGCKGCGFPCAATKPQMGGAPNNAPLTIFTEGKPLQYNFDMQDNFTGLPVFVPVRK